MWQHIATPIMVRVITTLAFGAALAAGTQLPRVLPIRPMATVELVAPSQGPIAGGTLVTITGSGFTNATVLIDGQPVAPIGQSDTAITLRMAAHDNGYVVIAVAAPGSATVYGRYLYVPPRLEDLPPGHITTVAGIGNFKGDFGPALEATLAPTSIAIDGDGDLYVTEPDFYEVTRIRTDGVIERFAGTGEVPEPGQGCCRDGGPASNAVLSFTRGVAVDRNGNVFIADDTNYRIRRVDAATGIITTFAGTGVRGFSGDGGPASAARMGTVTYLAGDGVDLYLFDFDNARIRRIDGTTGCVSAT